MYRVSLGDNATPNPHPNIIYKKKPSGKYIYIYITDLNLAGIKGDDFPYPLVMTNIAAEITIFFFMC